jgi:hypothetical protein
MNPQRIQRCYSADMLSHGLLTSITGDNRRLFINMTSSRSVKTLINAEETCICIICSPYSILCGQFYFLKCGKKKIEMPGKDS